MNNPPEKLDASPVITLDDLQDEMFTHGRTVDDAHASLLAQAEAEINRLDELTLDPSAKISEIISASAAATARANEFLAEKRAAISQIESLIQKLGLTNSKIAELKSLVLPEDETIALGELAVKRYIINWEAPCLGHRTESEATLKSLMNRSALTPHIKRFLLPLEECASELVKQIKAATKESRINLAKLLENMGKSPQRFPSFALQRNSGAFSELCEISGG